MIQKNQGTINLKAIRFQVDDLEANIAFYRKLGCVIENVENSNYTISAFISFNHNSEVLIHLLKDFRHKDELTAAEKAPVFEITAIEEEDHGFPEVFDKIYENGIQYTNVDPEKAISEVAQFEDLSGHKWELINDFRLQNE